jgi:hypothetical protein
LIWTTLPSFITFEVEHIPRRNTKIHTTFNHSLVHKDKYNFSSCSSPSFSHKSGTHKHPPNLGKFTNSKSSFKHCLLSFNKYFSSFYGIFLAQFWYFCKWCTRIMGIPQIWHPNIIPSLFYIHTFTFKALDFKLFFIFQPFVSRLLSFDPLFFSQMICSCQFICHLFFWLWQISNFFWLEVFMVTKLCKEKP